MALRNEKIEMVEIRKDQETILISAAPPYTKWCIQYLMRRTLPPVVELEPEASPLCSAKQMILDDISKQSERVSVKNTKTNSSCFLMPKKLATIYGGLFAEDSKKLKLVKSSSSFKNPGERYKFQHR